MSNADLEAARAGETIGTPEIVIVPRPRIEQTDLGDMDEDNAARYISYRMRKEIKPRTLQDWRLKGEGPKYIAGPGGRPITYRETDIDRWFETKCLKNPHDRFTA